MDKNTQIQNIIQKRRPLATQIETVEKNLIQLAAALGKIEDYRNYLAGKATDNSVITVLGQINVHQLQVQLQIEIDQLEKLKVRFARETLNIGVVGRARQGKSRLLQSLTQLTNAEIPDGDRQHCTGVRSTIYHAEGIDPYGEVSFYSEQSFLSEIIVPYYEELQLGSPPKTLDAFFSQALPILSPTLQDYAEPRAKYEYLRRYRSKYQEYGDLLRRDETLTINRNQIREYVAQDDVTGERVFFKYLAVREVKIFCTFRNQDVKQIALVDMPGLGDTGIGDESRLVRALGQDVDIVLFVRMPKSSGDSWLDVDVSLYDTAHKALVELPIHLWSFMVLNRTNINSKNGNNENNCEDLKNTLNEKHLQVVDCLVKNCSESDEAAEILDRVINYLMENITSLDSRYAGSRQSSLLQTHQAVHIELEKAKYALSQYASGNSLFKELFDDFWARLTTNLEDFLKEIRQRLGEDEPQFKKKLDDVMQKVRQNSGVPKDNRLIEQGRNCEGSYVEIYCDYLHKIRTDLSKHFLSLDGEIQQSLENIKKEIAHRLINQVGFKIIETSDPQPLKSIALEIRKHLENSNLELGFQTLADFNVSFAGIIQRQLRQYLDELNPDMNLLRGRPLITQEELMEIAQILVPSALNILLLQVQQPSLEQLWELLQGVTAEVKNPNPEQGQALRKINYSLDGQTILDALQRLNKQVIDQCEQVLNNLLKEPNYIAYAMTAEFVDRVLRSGNKRPGDVRNDWELLLGMEEIRPRVWTQFQEIYERSHERLEWLSRIEEGIQANQVDQYRFIN